MLFRSRLTCRARRHACPVGMQSKRPLTPPRRPPRTPPARTRPRTARPAATSFHTPESPTRNGRGFCPPKIIIVTITVASLRHVRQCAPGFSGKDGRCAALGPNSTPLLAARRRTTTVTCGQRRRFMGAQCQHRRRHRPGEGAAAAYVEKVYEVGDFAGLRI